MTRKWNREQTTREKTAEHLAGQMVPGNVYDGHRTMCSTRYQCYHYESSGGEMVSVHAEPTDEPILGPLCPVHGGPMHRVPGLPGFLTGWNCHGYDGEGCTISLVTLTESQLRLLLETA